MNRTLNSLLGAAVCAVVLTSTAYGQTGSLQGRRTIFNDGGTTPTTYNRITLTTPADATLTGDYQLLLPPNDGNADDIIFTPDGTGTLEFTDGNGLFWRLLGNYSTTPYNGTIGNFVGTQDAQNLVIRAGGANSIQFWNGAAGGTQKMILDANGLLGLGVTPGGSYMAEISDATATYHGLSVSTTLSASTALNLSSTSPGGIGANIEANDVGMIIGAGTSPVNGIELDATGVGILLNADGTAPSVGISMDGSATGLVIQNSTTAMDVEGDVIFNNNYTGDVSINSAATSSGDVSIGFGTGAGVNVGIGEAPIGTHLLSINGTPQTTSSALPNVRVDHLGGAAITNIYVNDGNNGLITSDVNGDLIKYDENTVLNPFAWLTTGNTIVGGNNILGTISNHDIDIRTNNLTAATIAAATQNIGIGTAVTATDRLVVDNTINVVGTDYNGGDPAYRLNNNNFLWEGAGGTDNTLVGYTNNTTISGNNNTSVGRLALAVGGAANNNTAVGSSALRFVTTGGANVAVGFQALYSVTTGGNNVGIGQSALFGNVGALNVAIGSEAGNKSGPTSAGSNNTYIGSRAGNQNSGSGNVFLGYDVGNALAFNALSNTLAIDNSNTTTPLISGSFATDQLTLNVAAGTAASLLVPGTAQTAAAATPNVRVGHLGGAALTTTYTNDANNGIITSDVNGDMRKYDENTVLNPFAWLTTGNTIVGGNNRFGTNSNDAVQFYTNNTQRFTLQANGNLENPLGNIMVNDNIDPTGTATTNTIGTNANRWANGYFLGTGGLHVGNTGGVGSAELAVTYGSNIAHLNVNGGASEIRIDQTSAPFSIIMDPNSTGTATSTLTGTEYTLNFGAGTDLTFTESTISRNGAATETLNFSNSGGVLNVEVDGSLSVDNNSTLGDADGDVQSLRGVTVINTAGNAPTTIGSLTNTSSVAVRANNDITIDVAATTNDLILGNIASTTTPVNMLTIENSGAVRQKLLTSMADEGIQFDATSGEFKLGHDTPGSNPITSTRTVNIDPTGSLAFTTDGADALSATFSGSADNLTLTKTVTASAGIMTATITGSGLGTATIAIEGVGTGSPFNQYGLVGRANYTGGASASAGGGPYSVGVAGTTNPTGGTIKNWGIQGSSNTANAGSNVGLWGNAINGAKTSIGVVGVSGNGGSQALAEGITWNSSALLPAGSTVGVLSYNDLGGLNNWSLVTLGRALFNGEFQANTTGGLSTDIGGNGNATGIHSSTINIGTGAYATTANIGTSANATVNVLGDVNINATGAGGTDIGNTSGGVVNVQGNGTNGLNLLGDGTAGGDNTIVIDPGTAGGLGNEYDLVLNNILVDSPIQDLLWITAGNEVRRATLTLIANEGVAFETSAFRLGSATDGTNPIVSTRYVRMNAGGSLTFNSVAAGQTLVMDNATGNIGVNQSPTSTHELSVTSVGGSGGVAINNGSVALEIGAVTPPVLGAGITASGTGALITLGGTGVVGVSSNGPTTSVGFQSTGSAVSFDGDGDLFIDGSSTLGDDDADITTARGIINLNTTNTSAGSVNINTTGFANSTTIGNAASGSVVQVLANDDITIDVGAVANDLRLQNIATTTVPVNMLSLDGSPSGNVRVTPFSGTADEGLVWDGVSGDYKLGAATDGINPIVSNRFVRLNGGGTLAFTSAAANTLLSMTNGGATRLNGTTVNINSSGGGIGSTSIGNASGTFDLTSTELNISSAGVITDATSAVQISDDLETTATTTFGDGTGTDNSTFNLGGTGTISVNNSLVNADLVINEVSISRSNADIGINPGATNKVTTNGSMDVSQNLTVLTGNATIQTGNLTISNAGQTSNIAGHLNVDGNTALGNSATDNVTLRGLVNINDANGAAATNIGTGTTTGAVTIGGVNNTATMGSVTTFNRGVNVNVETFTTANAPTVTLDDDNYVAIFTNTTGNNITLSLPTAVGRNGRIIVVKVASTGDVTIDPATTETIDGVASITINGGGNLSRTIVSNGTNWFVIGN